MTANPTQHFYDRISHAYDLIADGGEHVARERGLELLNAQRGEAVLEIGYGTGHSLVALANAVGEQGSVTGVDLSPGMRDVALKRLQDAGCEGRVELLVQLLRDGGFQLSKHERIDLFTMPVAIVVASVA